MNLNGIIYTTNSKRFVERRLPGIKKTISQTQGITIGDFEIVEIPKLDRSTPTVRKGNGVRIDWNWLMDKYPPKGKVLCLHISREERDVIGLQHPTPGQALGGSYNRNIGDDSMEFVIIADTNSAFDQKFLHELSHGFAHWTGKEDLTHRYDYDLKAIADIYITYSFVKWNKLTTFVSLWTQLRDIVIKVKNLPVKRLSGDFRVTQKYGEVNAEYTRTGHHIGVDYACPVGTSIIAPVDGYVSLADYSEDLGYYCYFVYEIGGNTFVDRLCHLSVQPISEAPYKKGEVFALTGNTGRSTGPHLHIDTWRGSVSVANITKDNWQDLTIDPEHLYK